MIFFPSLFLFALFSPQKISIFVQYYAGNFSSNDGSSPRSKSSSKSPKHRSHRRHNSQGKSSRRPSSGETSLGTSPFSSPASSRSLSSKSPESPWIRKKKEEDPLNSDYWKKVSGLSTGYETQQANTRNQGTVSTADDLLQMGEDEKKFEFEDSEQAVSKSAAEQGKKERQDRASTTTICSLDQVEPAPPFTVPKSYGDVAEDDR